MGGRKGREKGEGERGGRKGREKGEGENVYVYAKIFMMRVHRKHGV